MACTLQPSLSMHVFMRVPCACLGCRALYDQELADPIMVGVEAQGAGGSTCREHVHTRAYLSCLYAAHSASSASRQPTRHKASLPGMPSMVLDGMNQQRLCVRWYCAALHTGA